MDIISIRISKTLSGKIEFYDMNFENHHIGEVDYSNKIAKAVKISGLTSELKMKYNDIFKSNVKYIQALRKQKKISAKRCFSFTVGKQVQWAV